MSAPATLTKKQQKAAKHHSSSSSSAPTPAAASASTSTLPASNEEVVADPLSLLPRGKKTKNKRKLARDEKAGEDVIGDEEEETMGEEQEEKRVVKKMKVGAEGKATKVEGGGAGAAAAATGEKKAPGTPGERGKPKTKARFILFVGNLPFTTTGPEVATFFEEHIKFKPTVRLLTSKPDPNAKGKAREGGKSRGIAFVEFTSSTPLQAALLLHHIPFPTPDSPRLLNIELTSGGGGSSVARKTKIATKNSSMRQQAGMEGILTAEQVAEKGDEGWGGKGKEKRESTTRRGQGGEGGRGGGRGGERGGRGGGRGGRGGGGGGGGARGGGIDLAGSSRGRSKWAAGTGANGMVLG
ncbi:hypothetical protein BDY24DRAFT_437870 [Mrakia frigida]|uniref:uncharacterized protein n=1 Tax=Mrakia frigida TaxID=29902 RepID=UPI003FCC137C